MHSCIVAFPNLRRTSFLNVRGLQPLLPARTICCNHTDTPKFERPTVVVIPFTGFPKFLTSQAGLPALHGC